MCVAKFMLGLFFYRQQNSHSKTLKGSNDGFRWCLVQWFEATETSYYRAVDFSHTLRLGGICSCSLNDWLYNFCSRISLIVIR
ncbi:hypothetical protein Taro_021724 [Colocasia esculenta]|uniref:Uncharacterized protein n=1 Tax=Colocasia esculenta TaxID=4460 RepID=A0A843UZP6_COLES|nr:hypothetical protein [Colocasia esculenta]